MRYATSPRITPVTLSDFEPASSTERHVCGRIYRTLQISLSMRLPIIGVNTAITASNEVAMAAEDTIANKCG